MREILTRRRLIKLRVSYRKKHKKHPIQKNRFPAIFFVYSEYFAEKTSNVRTKMNCVSNIFYGKRVALSAAYLSVFPVSGRDTSAQQETKIYQIVTWGQQNLTVSKIVSQAIWGKGRINVRGRVHIKIKAVVW